MTKPCVKPSEEKLRRSKGRAGVIYTWSDGRRFYLASRALKDIWHHGHPSISDAVRAGSAAWLFDDETVHELRLKGVNVVGVKVRDSGDIWITHLSFLLDRDKAPVVSARGLSWRALPFSYFKRRAGKLKLR